MLWLRIFFKPGVEIDPSVPTRLEHGERYHEVVIIPELFRVPPCIKPESVQYYTLFTQSLPAPGLYFSGEYRLRQAVAILKVECKYSVDDYHWSSSLNIRSESFSDLQNLWRRIHSCTILPYLWHPGQWHNPLSWIGKGFNNLRLILSFGRM